MQKKEEHITKASSERDRQKETSSQSIHHSDPEHQHSFSWVTKSLTRTPVEHLFSPWSPWVYPTSADKTDLWTPEARPPPQSRETESEQVRDSADC